METYTAEELASLIGDIRIEMTENSNTRRSLRERPRPERTHVIDIEAWRRQLVALKSKGIDDLTIGYWRISTGHQEEGLGPDLQQKAIISWAIANTERAAIDMWVWDIDSGKEESRIGFDFIREAVASGAIRQVCAYRYDRLARNQFYAELIHREFKLYNTQQVSATENLPKGFLGDLMRQILQAFAQYEAAVIVERMNRGKIESVRTKGVYAGGEVPYGYLTAGTRGDTGKGVLKVCESEAKVIQLIFELYRRGYSQTAIANYLNNTGIPTRFQGRTGWRQGQIRRVLIAEPAYRAEALFSAQTEFQMIAHDAILPHRSELEQRTYLFGNVEMLKFGTQVPEDLVGTPISPTLKANSIYTMTRKQVSTLLLLFRYRDAGRTQKWVANQLNEMGLFTLEGRRWCQTNVQFYMSRRRQYEATIKEMGAVSIFAPLHEPVEDRSGKEVEAIARIRLLRVQGLSIKKITDKINEEGYRTRLGNPWYQSTVERVLKGHVRDAERAAPASYGFALDKSALIAA